MRINNWFDLLMFSKFVLSVPATGLGRPKAVSDLIVQRCSEFQKVDPASKLNVLSTRCIPARGTRLTTKRGLSNDDLMAKRVQSKLEEANFRGAVNLVRCEDTLAPFDSVTFNSLKSKHPPTPSDRRPLAQPDAVNFSCDVATSTIYHAALSFPAGSSGGPDGLSPQHLKDLLRLDGVDGPLAAALSSFINEVLLGHIPQLIKPFFFGARLTAFIKKDGGLRPIAVGMTLRRLAAKVIASQATATLKQSFEPFQLGVGVARGLEVGVHVARNFLYNLSPGQALIKLDFKNAFNSICRDTVLEAVNLSLPFSYPLFMLLTPAIPFYSLAVIHYCRKKGFNKVTL